MNDFTKEELEDLLRSHMFQHYNYQDSIYFKLISMIENYCAHKIHENGECLMKICNMCARLVG